jgi:diphthamide biosynthesis methyltransferase
VADSLPELAGRTFGDPLHMLVVPADLHRMEAEALDAFAGLPAAFAPEAERRR